MPGHGAAAVACRALRRQLPSSSSRRLPDRLQRDERRRCSTASTPASRAWRSSRARAAARADRRPRRRSRRRGRSRTEAVRDRKRRRDLPAAADGLRAVRAAARASCAPCRSTRRPRSRSSSACARRSASSSRRFSSPAASAVEALADDGVVVAGPAGAVSRDRRQPRRRRRRVKQVRLRRLRRRRRCARMARVSRRPAAGRRAWRARRLPHARRRAGRADVAQERSGGALRADADGARRARACHEPYWHREGEAGPLYVRRRRAVRPAVSADAVLRPGDAGASRAGEEVIERPAGQYRYEATSSAARSDPSCWSCRRCRCASRRRSPSCRPAAVPTRPVAPRRRRASRGAHRGRGRAGTARRKLPRATAAASDARVRVTVVNDTPGPAESVVKLELPPGWTVDAGRAAGDVHARRRIADGAVPGAAAARREAGRVPHRARSRRSGGRTFNRGYPGDRVPAHPAAAHLRRRPRPTLKVIDVRTAPNLTVGYIMGVGDEVPAAIEQLGAKVEMLSADDLAWGDLSRFDTIVTGVRAYERRADLRANNSRLLDYVRNGGTLIVQYNKFEFNEAQYGPYPAKVSSDRVTDERAPVTILAARRSGVHHAERDLTDAAWNGGCRSAACISSARRIRATAISCSSRIRSRTTRARRPARWSKRPVRQRTLGLRRPRLVARAAGRRRRRLSAAREPDQPARHERRTNCNSIADCRFGDRASNPRSESPVAQPAISIATSDSRNSRPCVRSSSAPGRPARPPRGPSPGPE